MYVTADVRRLPNISYKVGTLNIALIQSIFKSHILQRKVFVNNFPVLGVYFREKSQAKYPGKQENFSHQTFLSIDSRGNIYHGVENRPSLRDTLPLLLPPVSCRIYYHFFHPTSPVSRKIRNTSPVSRLQ
jgi:hypothetical protein